MPPKAAKAKKGAPTPSPKRQKKPVTKESSDEDSSDDADDSDEEVAVVKKPVKGANGKANGAPAADSDDSGDSEESDSEDEKPKAKSAKRKATPAKPQSAKKSKKEESSEESESESEDEKPAKVAAKEESDSEEDDSEEEEETKKAESDEEDSEDESDDGSDDEEAEVGKKRKAKDSAKAAKKAKVEVPTVIVNNLPEDIAEKKVKKFFEKKGISVKEIRKNQNKNFCHIDLEDASQMDAALALDGEELKGSAIKVAKASAKGAPANFDEMPKAQKDKVSLFVKNLPEDATEDSVKDHFDGCVEIKMPTKPDGSNRGFAILFFPEESDVESAMENKQGSDLDGSALLLDYCGDKSNKKTPNKAESRPKSTAEAGQTKVLFVKNLSYDTDEDSLRQAFEGCVGARVATFQDSGKPRGFGFVDFASEADAKAAFDSMNGADLDGREIKLDFATERGGGGDRGGRGGGRGRGFGGDRGGGGYGGGRGGGRDFGSRPPSEKSNTLFVGNLSFDTDKDSLESAFDGCKTARVATFPDSGKPRGFGYVEFDSENAAESAFKSMKDHEIDGRAIRLDYSAPRGDGGGGRGGGRGRGGFGGGRGGGGFGGRGGGGFGGRGGGRGFGDRGGGRGGRGGRGGFVQKKDGIRDFAGKKKTFDD